MGGSMALIRRQNLASSVRIGGAVGLLAVGAMMFNTQPAAAASCLYPQKLTRAAPSYDCISAAEKSLVDLRKFRAEITVAALRCNQQGLYNSVITRHNGELIVKGKALGKTFRRLHGASAKKELNRFVTFLTNRASIKSLGIQNYCGTMSQVMTEALQTPVRGFMAFVDGNPVRRATAVSAVPAAVTVADKSGAAAPAR